MKTTFWLYTSEDDPSIFWVDLRFNLETVDLLTGARMVCGDPIVASDADRAHLIATMNYEIDQGLHDYEGRTPYAAVEDADGEIILLWEELA
jgi:hypothetical protein